MNSESTPEKQSQIQPGILAVPASKLPKGNASGPKPCTGHDVVRLARSTLCSLDALSAAQVVLIAGGTAAEKLGLSGKKKLLWEAQATVLVSACAFIKWAKAKHRRNVIPAATAKRNGATLMAVLDLKCQLAKPKLVFKHPDLADEIEAVAHEYHCEANSLKKFAKVNLRKPVAVDPVTAKIPRQLSTVALALIAENRPALAEEIRAVEKKYLAGG